ncbi:NUDIX hydrolase [Tundrisphaera sp. TA3]|uniref:NUDIX hydrolase n=1 Tax=Tundrisphaera sp. TA3 TaxID=3435775 RepID=UPI003EC0AE66
MPEPWRILETRTTFRDRWLSVRTDRCVDRQGREVAAYHVLEFPGWVNVVALDPQRRIVLAREYRHGLGAVVTGLPCGSMEPGDAGPEVAARRELEEETGYRGGRFLPLSGLPANPANQDNTAWSFLALDVRPDGVRRPDPTEEIEVVLEDFAPFLGRIWRGERSIQVSHALALHQAGLYLMGDRGEDGALRAALRAEFARTIGPG